MVGIKGTGMAAFAELLLRRGALVSGSDVDEKFYTDEILTKLGIHYNEGFSADHITDSIKLIIHSSAYGDDNPEMVKAKEFNIPTMVYTEALGYLSTLSESFGIAGVHGKTTTTAIAGTLAGAAGLEASVLVGSAVPTFGGFSTACFGEKYFIAETCEYMRHFLDFCPSSIVLTSIELDHLDYFKDNDDILDAFLSYIDKLPKGGDLIYCDDDRGASEAARLTSGKRPDINLVPYGENCSGDFRVYGIKINNGFSSFRLKGFNRDFSIRIPGNHLILDSAAAIALTVRTILKEKGYVEERDLDNIVEGLHSFTGTKRRSEIVGEEKGVLIMDDYAHHPTAIRLNLEGLRKFYPDKRIIVDFMSHTYSRTDALIDQFATSFGSADLVLLHKIYASAREKYNGDVTGYDLYKKTAACTENVEYFEKFSDAEEFCMDILKEGDLFITMGAGNNWQIGKNILNRLKEQK